jgi:hypothetical protein
MQQRMHVHRLARDIDWKVASSNFKGRCDIVELVPCMHRADRDNPEMCRTVQNFIESSGEIKNILKFVAVSLNKLNM